MTFVQELVVYDFSHTSIDSPFNNILLKLSKDENRVPFAKNLDQFIEMFPMKIPFVCIFCLGGVTHGAWYSAQDQIKPLGLKVMPNFNPTREYWAHLCWICRAGIGNLSLSSSHLLTGQTLRGRTSPSGVIGQLVQSSRNGLELRPNQPNYVHTYFCSCFTSGRLVAHARHVGMVVGRD